MAYKQKEYSGYTSPVPKRSCGRRSTGAKMAYPDTPATGKKGLWANIHAKRKRGESPAKPGDKDYPTDKALKDSQTPASMKKEKCTCWEGYSRVPGTKACAPGSCKKD